MKKSCSAFPEHLLHVRSVQVGLVNEVLKVYRLQVYGLKCESWLILAEVATGVTRCPVYRVSWHQHWLLWRPAHYHQLSSGARPWGPGPGPSRPWSWSRHTEPCLRASSCVFVVSYLLISHRCIVNFPSLSLIHAGITDLRKGKYLFSARHKNIKSSMSPGTGDWPRSRGRPCLFASTRPWRGSRASPAAGCWRR